jgi:outer membrane immunogenic protein
VFSILEFPVKSVVAAVVGLLAVGGMGIAQAADRPARNTYRAPEAVDPGLDWSGFYVGANAAASWGHSDDTFSFGNGAGRVLFSNSGSSDLKGLVGGGQAGFNWQMQSLVFGLESDIQATSEQASRGFICGTAVCTSPIFNGIIAVNLPVAATLSEKIGWFGTVRGRVGILAFPKVLIYATGGLAYGEVTSTLAVGALSPVSMYTAKVGYSFGGGVETALASNWSAKFEYLYVDLGDLPLGLATNLAAVGGGALIGNSNSKITDNIWRVGVNYKFSGPVGAR